MIRPWSHEVLAMCVESLCLAYFVLYIDTLQGSVILAVLERSPI
jgi:hypothetical protein